jgi:hypothetical protein
MPPEELIVAVALLTARELSRLHLPLDRAWPVDQTPCFHGLLEAIDEADRKFRLSPAGVSFSDGADCQTQSPRATRL